MQKLFFILLFAIICVALILKWSFAIANLNENINSFNKSELSLQKRITDLLSTTVKVEIPDCKCSKRVRKPSNERPMTIGREEITCSKENLVIGPHQRVVSYTFYESGYGDPQNRNYFDGIE